MPDMPEEVVKRRRDAAIAGIAAWQHGVISVKQLRSLGVPSSAIGDRFTSGRLHRIHRSVYAVGHPNIGNEGRWMAAVLACGEGAVLSHSSAAELWRIRHPRGPSAASEGFLVHVTLPGTSGGRRRKGIAIHRSRTLSPADCTLRDGIPVTRPGRTLADLRRILPPRQFAAALREAEFLGLPTGDQFGSDHTRSELEARFLALLRRRRLPQPEVNVLVDRFVVDFLWRSRRLIVEVDGWDSHRTRSAFEGDRARDARLKVLGYEVVRVTWRQIEDDAAAVAQTLLALLQR
jgi:very-short-patch-repair endonuclease